jgi:putative tricarboxylic transport membrane protein
MVIGKDHIAGLLFLCFSVVYGYFTLQTQLMPGDVQQSFNAQTLPRALSIMGVVLSIALLLTAEVGMEEKFYFRNYKFSLVIQLLLLIVAFAVALKWIGFALSTVFFLASGFWVLGERSIKRILLVSVIFSICTWFMLTRLLDVYLAPGLLFDMFLGS